MSEQIDIGHGFSMSYFRWAPDRELNPQYADIPDVDRAGIIVDCPHGIGGAVHFDVGERMKEIFPNSNFWTVQSWDPLTLDPSILCTECGCHGYIRNGAWEPC